MFTSLPPSLYIMGDMGSGFMVQGKTRRRSRSRRTSGRGQDVRDPCSFDLPPPCEYGTYKTVSPFAHSSLGFEVPFRVHRYLLLTAKQPARPKSSVLKPWTPNAKPYT